MLHTPLLTKLKFLLTACLIFSLSSVLSADVVHDESADGDLSGDFSAPDQLMFLNGPNTIIGSMAESGLLLVFDWCVAAAIGHHG